MGKYLFQVLLTVIFWTSVIWFGLPLLKDHSPGPYNHLRRFFLPNPAIENIVVKVIANTEPTLKIFSDRSVKKRVHTDDQTIQEEAVDTHDDRLSALNRDPGYEWGIVVTNSFAYDTGMQKLGIFSGGTVVSRKHSELKMHGYVSECFYLKNRKWQSETVLLYDADLVIFDTTYENADVEQRNMLIKYCRTLAQYEEKRAEAYKKEIRKNPNFDAYKNALNEYNSFFKRAHAAKAELPEALGAERTKLMDELRKYRADEPLIVKQFKETKERYEAWKEEHIGSSQQPKYSKSADVVNLEKTLETMRPSVQKIVPGL